jgi:hypothetical protein
MKEKAELKKKQVKTMLLETDSLDLPDKLEFIDALERLGLDYHYAKEIHELLRNVSEAGDRGDLDLPTASLQFYLLRKHGYRISSGKIPNKLFLTTLYFVSRELKKTLEENFNLRHQIRRIKMLSCFHTFRILWEFI